MDAVSCKKLLRMDDMDDMDDFEESKKESPSRREQLARGKREDSKIYIMYGIAI